MNVAPLTLPQNPLFLGPSSRIETGHAGAQLHVAVLDRSHFAPDLFEAYGIAQPAKLDRAIDKRKAEFLAGRALANRTLAALGQPPAALPIGPNRAPIWPSGIHGAISHTEQFCACLVTTHPTQRAGVDIEAALSENAMKSVTRLVLDAREKQHLDAHTLPPATAMAAAFSGKETIYKALFPQVGTFFGFESARLVEISQDKLVFVLSKDLTADLPKYTKLNVALHVMEGHVLTWLLHDV